MSTDVADTGRVPDWTLGWRLQRSLAFAEMRAEEMADELGVVRATISRWMHDRGAPPRTIYIRQWALRTGVPYGWLTNGDGDPVDSTDGIPLDRGSMDSHIPDNSSYITTAGHLGSRRSVAVACGAAA